MSAAADAGRQPNVLFALEQVLGHVSVGQTLRRFVPEAAGFNARFVDVTFHHAAGRIERLPLPAYARASLRARLEVRAGLAGERADALFFNTQKPALFCPDYVRRTPTLISLDVTPKQYDDISALYEHEPDGGGIIARAKHAANRQLFRAARRLLPFSNWVKESLIRDYGVAEDRITVVAPGVDTTRWQPGTASDDGPVRVLFIGGNFVRKGGELLLDWFRTAPEAADVELHIVTRDPVPAADRVFVYSDMANNSEELVALAQRCSMFVLPTLADCFSNASMEAMAAGLPVITTNVGGIPDIIRCGQNGFIIEPGDPRALAEAMRALVLHPERRRAMGRYARTDAETRFDARTQARAVVAEIDSVLNQGRAD